VRGAVGVWVFERIAQFAVVSHREPFQRQWRPRYVSAQTFELGALVGLAAHGRGIGKPGREVVGSAQSDMFLFCLENIEDIISKNHLSKGDYTTWFGRCADNYIESYARHSKKHKKDEVIDRLQWAIDLIPEVYTGKSIETGKKREAYLNERIETIKGL